MGKRITVKGKVQGVFYRASTKEKAESLNLTGWVKNDNNGDVSILAEGNEVNIQSLIKWCQQGPPLSRVDNVVVKEVQDLGYSKFEVRY